MLFFRFMTWDQMQSAHSSISFFPVGKFVMQLSVSLNKDITWF